MGFLRMLPLALCLLLAGCQPSASTTPSAVRATAPGVLGEPVAANAESADAFDLKRPERAFGWLITITGASREAGWNRNLAAKKAADEQIRKTLDKLQAQEISWPVTVDAIGEGWIVIKPFVAIMQDAERQKAERGLNRELPKDWQPFLLRLRLRPKADQDEDRLPAPAAAWVFKLAAGHRVQLTGTIASVQYEPREGWQGNDYKFTIRLASCRLAPGS